MPTSPTEPVRPNQTTGLTLVERILGGLANSVCQHPRWYFYPQVILVLGAVFYTIYGLKFSTSRNDLVGAEKRYHQNFLRFKEEFPGQDDLVTVVESESMEKNRQFVERLGRKLEGETNLFSEVFYKGDLKNMGSKALLFLPEETLSELKQTLADYRPFIDQFSKATNLVSLFDLINRQFYLAGKNTNDNQSALLKAFPALERIIQRASESLDRDGQSPSPGMDALFGAGEEAERQKYITFAKGRLYLVSAKARNEALNPEAVTRLREVVEETRKEIPGVNAGVTGEPVLEIDEMAQSQSDSIAATILSLVLVLALFAYAYREIGRPLKATICLVVGLVYSMAYTTAAVGHLNILTITFVPMLVGLAIDFGVHLISRFEEELRSGKSVEGSLRIAMVHTGKGVFTGCLTTAGAFFAMGATDFKGIQEMGIICGGGLIVCLVPMMTLLPVLLLRGSSQAVDSNGMSGVAKRARLEQLWLSRPGLIITLTSGITVLSALGLSKVGFDYNLLNMQSAGLPAVEFEKKLVASAGKSVLFAAVVADSVSDANKLKIALTKLSVVYGVDSMATYLERDSTAERDLVHSIRREAESISFGPIDQTPVDTKEFGQVLWSLGGYVGLAIKAIREEQQKSIRGTASVQSTEDQKLENLEKQLHNLRNQLETLRRRMLLQSGSIVGNKLGVFQRALFHDIHDTFQTLREQEFMTGMGIEDLPDNLRRRFVGKTGKHLLQVYPKEDVWNREPQERFVMALRTLDPDVTGTPVQLFEYTSLLKKSYEVAARDAAIAIAVLVFIHFRSVVCVFLSLLPVGLGMLWMVGLMAWRGIDFNPANIMTLPLVIGIGVTSGIHILNRFAEEDNPSLFGKSTGKAVLISALTTVAGFGSLILAEHQGIRSLGFVMSVGTSTCMLGAVVFLPVLLKVMKSLGWQMNLKP